MGLNEFLGFPTTRNEPSTCPRCGSRDVKTFDIRHEELCHKQCRSCGHSWTGFQD